MPTPTEIKRFLVAGRPCRCVQRWHEDHDQTHYRKTLRKRAWHLPSIVLAACVAWAFLRYLNAIFLDVSTAPPT